MTTFTVRLEGERPGKGDQVHAASAGEAAQAWARARFKADASFDELSVVVVNPDGVATRLRVEVEMAPVFKVFPRFR